MWYTQFADIYECMEWIFTKVRTIVGYCGLKNHINGNARTRDILSFIDADNQDLRLVKIVWMIRSMYITSNGDYRACTLYKSWCAVYSAIKSRSNDMWRRIALASTWSEQ
jgi:hypothetical protein